MIKKAVKRSTKTTSVKVNNKAQNKANRTKQSKTAKKRKQQDGRANNISLARQKFQDDVESDEDEADTNDYVEEDNYSGGTKRKRATETDKPEEFEDNYKVKTYLKEGAKARNEKIFALPVKNESGRMVRNTRKPIEEVEESKWTKKVQVAVVEKEKEEEEEKPKTAMQLIQERKQSLEKNKQKIALFSRDVLHNPQEEVGWIDLFWCQWSN